MGCTATTNCCNLMSSMRMFTSKKKRGAWRLLFTAKSQQQKFTRWMCFTLLQTKEMYTLAVESEASKCYDFSWIWLMVHILKSKFKSDKSWMRVGRFTSSEFRPRMFNFGVIDRRIELRKIKKSRQTISIHTRIRLQFKWSGNVAVGAHLVLFLFIFLPRFRIFASPAKNEKSLRPMKKWLFLFR